MGKFFIDTQSGAVATHRQLVVAGTIAEGEDLPPRPWHRINGTSDATTLWYAVLRKPTRGIYLGTLVFRHSPHHASLLEDGWEEVDVDEIRGAGPTQHAGDEPAGDPQAM